MPLLPPPWEGEGRSSGGERLYCLPAQRLEETPTRRESGQGHQCGREGASPERREGSPGGDTCPERGLGVRAQPRKLEAWTESLSLPPARGTRDKVSSPVLCLYQGNFWSLPAKGCLTVGYSRGQVQSSRRGAMPAVSDDVTVAFPAGMRRKGGLHTGEPGRPPPSASSPHEFHLLAGETHTGGEGRRRKEAWVPGGCFLETSARAGTPG